MPHTPPNPELLRSLGRLARGLSILFWGLPICLLACVFTREGHLRLLNVAPPIFAFAWLLFGLYQLGQFQRQERVWRAALDRAKVLTMINVGLSPFLFWWSRAPEIIFFKVIVVLFGATSLFFLSELNVVLVRLTAMLPEETLRQETKQFALFNRIMILVTLLVALGYQFFLRLEQRPLFLEAAFQDPKLALIVSRILFSFAIFLVLAPLAVTMALLWKTKEVILNSVFGGAA